MNSLTHLQSVFLKALLDPQQTTPPQILPNQRQDATQRMKLYQDGYRLRLVEALCDTFPGLHTLAGDELFEEICLSYIENHPSHHYSIRYYGHELDAWLAKHDTFMIQPILGEMAQFEWQLRNAFDGPNAVPLQRSHLSSISIADWPQVKFEFLPTYARLALKWNVPQLWKAIELNAAPQQPKELDEEINWIIWRPELDIKFRSVDEIELIALQQIERNCNFTKLCEVLDDAGIIEPPQTIVGLLNRWLDDGLIAHAALPK